MSKPVKLYLFIGNESMKNVYSDFLNAEQEEYCITLVDQSNIKVGVVNLSFDSNSKSVVTEITYGDSVYAYMIDPDKLEASLSHINFLHRNGVYSVLEIEPLPEDWFSSKSRSISVSIPARFVNSVLSVSLITNLRHLGDYKFEQGSISLRRENGYLTYTLNYTGIQASYSYTESVKATSISDEIIRSLIFKPVYFTLSGKSAVQEIVLVEE